MEERVIRSTHRSKALIVLLRIVAPFAAAYLLWLGAHFYSSHVASLPTCDQLRWFRLVLLLGFAGLLAFALGFLRNGLRIWRSGQYPAPGALVFFTTRVSTGSWARVSAGFSFLMACIAAAGLIAMLHLFVFSEAGLYILGFRSCGA